MDLQSPNERRSPSSEYLRTGGRKLSAWPERGILFNVSLQVLRFLKRVDAGVGFRMEQLFLRAPAFLREIIPSADRRTDPAVDGDYRLGASADGGYRNLFGWKEKIHR